MIPSRESLKERVQQLEAAALVEALNIIIKLF